MTRKTLGIVLVLSLHAATATAQTNPTITTPVPGTTLSSSSQQFQWTPGVGVSHYWLYVGSAAGGRDLFDQDLGGSLTATVSGLPTDGRALYVRLWWVRADSWEWADFQYTAASGGGGGGPLPQITVPIDSTPLTGSSQLFQWTPGTGISRYWLYVGSTPGSSDLFNQDQGGGVSVTVTGLPTDGRVLHVRLWWIRSGAWEFADYQFTAAGGGGGGTNPQITSPAPGATLAGATQTFTWTTGTGVSRYWLYVGSSPGAADFYNQDRGSSLTATVTGLPTDGRAIHVRLWWLRGSVWEFGDVQYIAATGGGSQTLWVAPGGTGDGGVTTPFGRIQDAIAAAQPGTTIAVKSGTFNEALSTVRGGTSIARITIRAADGPGTVLITSAGRVLTMSHPYITIDGVVLDGQYGADDTVRVSGAAHFWTLRYTEVRRSSRDLIDMVGAAQGVLIENCLIHHALFWSGARADAHGIAAGPVQDFTIRDTEIHTFSGDGIQVDPGRSAPGWNRVTIERTRIWLAPLPAPENGFPAGLAPGENGIDTKADPAYPRATLILRDVTAWGFRDGMLVNMAAFNLKEHVDVTVAGVTVYDSEIAFRLRGAVTGGAWVAITNAVVYNVLTGFRYEDNIQNLRIWNSTVGGGVTRVFQAASSGMEGLNVRNLLVLGTLPTEALHGSNLSVTASAFVDAAVHNYELRAGSPAIDSGITLTEVTTDRIGTTRPQGAAYDVGAYERR